VTTPITKWHNTIVNAAEKKEILLYKMLFMTVVLQQDHGAAATSCFRVHCSSQFLKQMNFWMNLHANAMNSIVKAMNSIAKPTNSIASRTNSTAKAINLQQTG